METQMTISDWANKTFGPPKDPQTIVDRFMYEVAELSLQASDGNFDRAAGECADCLIVLYQVAQTLGFDLHEEVNKKMAINRARKWNIAGDGTGQHIED